MSESVSRPEYVVGVDVGGQSSKLGIVDLRSKVHARATLPMIDEKTKVNLYKDNVDLYVEDLAKLIRELAEKVGGMRAIRGIGMGVPNGKADTGEIHYAVNLPWKGIVPLRQLLQDKLGKPVTLTNDANAAAVGEMKYGAAVGLQDFIVLTLGTGVGSGIVTGGNVLYGHDCFAGELGHTIQVRNNGRPCACGRSGCLEAYCSAMAVARSAREVLETTDRETTLRDIPWENISAKDVFQAAERGDKVAIDIFNFTFGMLGAAAADFVAFSRPQRIILFGGLVKSRSEELIMKPFVDSLNDNLLALWKGKIEVRFSGLDDDDAPILGASALAWAL